MEFKVRLLRNGGAVKMAKQDFDDTIGAVSTPPGEGALGIIRLSGNESIPAAEKIFRSSSGTRLSDFSPNTVHHGRIVDAEGRMVDDVMIACFRSPHSYTGEDMVEISAHGGMKILKTITGLLVKQGVRHAEPGEFTKRAFLNGKMDLAQAEAVLDLIRAKTESAHRQAVLQLQGAFSEKIRDLREGILGVCAVAEASIDFPEEELDIDPAAEVTKNLIPVIREIDGMIQGFRRGAILREGALVVIAGKPNVGKSSLLNALLERDRAIVSHLPGTTRDILEEELEIGGFLVRIVDTAGIRSDPDGVEKMGIERAKNYLTDAQLVLMVLDGSREPDGEDRKILESLKDKKIILVFNKSDLPAKTDPEKFSGIVPPLGAVCVSAKTSAGVSDLEEAIRKAIWDEGLPTDSAWLTRLRHKQALESARECFARAEEGLRKGLSMEFIAFDLRQGVDCLGEIIGEVYSEEILGRIFRDFCIGK
ncbi:MAG TPA: tRNA uridine-5-carboxymethylaminomethyl(34) synthesis GTPase MnmE [Candidatus Omnitrophota bacterium]|nr:tRNA uridine-5-carboxymethylaminomethyl(34) synthesis GTPase MnmE [Candidatus Omnitrophota bacterium]